LRRSALPLAAAAAALLASRCASPTPDDAAHVRVTKDRAFVKPCVDIAKVKTDIDDQSGQPGEEDLKRQTADLGGNVLLIYNAHEGGAFYCRDLPPDIQVSGPSGVPVPAATPKP